MDINAFNKQQAKDNDKNWFRCPVCGGRISRRKRTINAVNAIGYEYYDQPECMQCGREYIVRVNEDLSYDVVDNN